MRSVLLDICYCFGCFSPVSGIVRALLLNALLRCLLLKNVHGAESSTNFNSIPEMNGKSKVFRKQILSIGTCRNCPTAFRMRCKVLVRQFRHMSTYIGAYNQSNKTRQARRMNDETTLLYYLAGEVKGTVLL